MLIIVSYDIQDNRKRTRLARKLRDFGPRVQKSVFEADIEDDEMDKLLAILEEVKLKTDESIRFYRVCEGCVRNIRIWGEGEVSLDKEFYIA